MFRSGCFLTHAFCTAVLILDFDNIHRFGFVASILCLKQILDCVRGLLFKFVDFLYSRSEVFARVIRVISSENVFFSLSFDV